MKNLLTLSVFVVSLLLGTSSVFAQEKYKAMEEQIKIEGQDLKKILDLDDDQTALLTRTMYAKERALADLNASTSMDAKTRMKKIEDVEMNFKSKMMQILSEEQFATFSKYLGKKKAHKE